MTPPVKIAPSPAVSGEGSPACHLLTPTTICSPSARSHSWSSVYFSMGWPQRL